MKRALVTLALGEKYETNFRSFCHDSWTSYARRHNVDIVVITHTLDNSARAASRSPAWQKCLILDQEQLRQYDQVAWVDSDILINPQSPSVFENVPLEMIGAVDAYATPNREDYRIALERLYEHWKKNGVAFISNLSATEYHNAFGLEGDFESVVQTGVMVLSPRYHNSLLQDVYNTYEDKGGAHWNYEMRPLSYEILRNKRAYWLNPKFNMGWAYFKQCVYPFLIARGQRIPMRRILRFMAERKCATTAFLNSYFLHFAGCAEEMRHVNQHITSTFDI
jgi:hypothetical protein